MSNHVNEYCRNFHCSKKLTCINFERTCDLQQGCFYSYRVGLCALCLNRIVCNAATNERKG